MKTFKENLDIKYPDGLYTLYKLMKSTYLAEKDQIKMIKTMHDIYMKDILRQLESKFINNSDYNKGLQDAINIIKEKI